MYTPWGKAQTIEQILPGVTAVSTASHGGIKLSKERFLQMPIEFQVYEPFTDQSSGHWYEEDQDALIPLAWFHPDENVRTQCLRAIEQLSAYFGDAGTKAIQILFNI